MNKMNELSVSYMGKSIKCHYGICADLALKLLGVNDEGIIALRLNNEIVPLKTQLLVDSELEGVYLDSAEGAMIYRRSLTFILEIAAYKLFPERILSIGHSLGISYYYNFDAGKNPSKKEISSLEKTMKAIVNEDITILPRLLSYKKALEIFSENRQDYTVSLLKQRSTPVIKVNECKGFVDIFIEPLVPRTGILDSFELMPYKGGFLLRFPAIGGGKIIEPFEDEPEIFKVYKDYKKWGRIIGVRSAVEINNLTASGDIKEYIKIAEAHQSRKIFEVAQQINNQKEKIKIVLLAGPSSSGKTTSAKRLAIELMVMGIKPIAISLDDYYVGTEKTPKDENGEPDYECLEALDTDYLNEQLLDIYKGKEVTLPHYDFKTGIQIKNKGRKIHLDRRMVLIVEGIHALNDALTKDIARDTKFKLYVSALTQLNLDNHNRIPTSDNRLLRRIVRDYYFRGKDAVFSINIWPKVQAGERKYIFPFQNTANAALNTALDYELPVLKYFADPILRAVKPDRKEFSESSRLLSFLENFIPIQPQLVPGTSILREFIGGSNFE